MSTASAGLWSAPYGDGSTPRRYVVADVFTDTPLQGTSSRCSPTAGACPPGRCSAPRGS